MGSIRQSLMMAVIIGLFAIVGVGAVTTVYNVSQTTIIENERAALIKQLSALLPVNSYNNDVMNDTLEWTGSGLTAEGSITIYRFRKDGWPVAVVIPAVAPDGYNGKIKLLVAITKEGVILSVRVVDHHETPGLGDKIEIERSDWINLFKGQSLAIQPESQWRVKRDGGRFDQLTGATITPRAIVKMVKKTVIFFEAHKNELFLLKQTEG